MASTKEVSFEEKIKKLESIVAELENGDVPLDDAINKYTEAMKLSKECSNKLTEVNEKVNKILSENGTLEDFEVKEQYLDMLIDRTNISMKNIIEKYNVRLFKTTNSYILNNPKM